ncbi:MAG: DUF2147 domain-containing protein [Bacteroidetes bacterium]|nr:DUF2147 domain-containing protein [Bacteroidota bacterium]
MRNTKALILAIAVVFSLTSFTHKTPATKADALLGTWLTEEGKAKVNIYKKDDKYYGKIIWLKVPNRDGKPKVDKFNDDKKLQTRPVLGLVILRGFVYDEGDNEWDDGHIYDAESGNDYSCYIKMKNPNTLLLRGYIGISIIGRTSVWTRE